MRYPNTSCIRLIACILTLETKGGVDGEVGRFRCNHLVPVPEVADLAELDRLIVVGCQADLARTMIGRTETVGDTLAGERPLLRALPAEPFDTTEDVAGPSVAS